MLLLGRGLAGLGLAVGAEQQRQLALYAGELERWNRRINLVARKTGFQDLMEKHFLDSLTLLALVDPSLEDGPVRLLDIGTGAGFPGLVLAVARPEMEVILVEPRLKRVSFLRHVIRFLGLENVTVLASRIEEASLPVRPTHVTSRALAEPAEFLRLIRDFLAAGVTGLLMLSPVQQEQLLRQLPPEVRIASTRRFRLPWSGAGRVVAAMQQSEARRQKPETGNQNLETRKSEP
jgi:16S rRNA (guanine527-N7)-methyltransferase